MNNLNKMACALGFFLMLPAASHATVTTFGFTGGLVVTDPSDNILLLESTGLPVTPIAGTWIFDDTTGAGSMTLSLKPGFHFSSGDPVFHEVHTQMFAPAATMGQMLVDWAGNFDMPLDIQWDLTGLADAGTRGLQTGDIISGNRLYRDALASGGNGNGVGDPAEEVPGGPLGSIIPHSDDLQFAQGYTSLQGPAPMAATAGSGGLGSGTIWPGMKWYFDIGTGNSMHVLSMTTVPVPAAAWLFGSGLLGLLGVARRRKTS